MTQQEQHEQIARPGEMFCFQCEQTAWEKGCTGERGMCGKSHETANEQDALTGALIGLARACADGGTPTRETERLILAGLFTTVTNVDFDRGAVEELKNRVVREKERVAGDRAPADYDMQNLWNAPEDIRSLKSLVLFGLRGMSAYAYHAFVLDYSDPRLTEFFYRALAALGDDGLGPDALRDLVLETGRAALWSMEILDKANTETFGNPEPTPVSMNIEKGPFIVITGHDLRDLKLLLEQTEGKGINIYTHGEMLPAHGYPELKKYPHLKGNFGTAWQRQRREFKDIPGPVVFTTNCLMPPPKDYADRIFTTEVVAYEGIPHIGENKDFTPVIEKALELGGYPEDQQQRGINGGENLTTGFGHAAVLSHAQEVLEAVKSGAIRRIFLVGGCDGAKPARAYYTDFVKETPDDTLILTLACGKYRFNDLELGTIGQLPRLMDMGQCNDAYSAVVVAQALAKAAGCGVNDLPLSLIISWYEQKAVCVLLALLALGIKNIRLGPTMPAFVSPNVLQFLSDTFALRPIQTASEDLKEILG